MFGLGLLVLSLLGAASVPETGPGSCFPDAAGLGAFEYIWYCNHLHALGEVGLPRGSESYRFVYLRCYHRPIIVRVQRIGQRWLLFAGVLSGKGGYEPGHVVQRVHRELSATEVGILQQRLSEAGFWSRADAQERVAGTDGAQWILEGRLDRDYRILDIWSPQGRRYSAFRALCLFLLDLARVRPAADEIY